MVPQKSVQLIVLSNLHKNKNNNNYKKNRLEKIQIAREEK